MLALTASAASGLPEVEVLEKNLPVGHQANGSIEVAIRELKRQMRAVRMSLEGKTTLENNHALVAWIGSFAAECINVYRKDSTGKTPYEQARFGVWREGTSERLGAHVSAGALCGSSCAYQFSDGRFR